MREILFRGKREDNGELVQGHYHNTTYVGYPNGGDNKITRHYILPKNAGDAHVVIAETVGQFTGLTDKNGKKIFEGDILRIVSKDYVGFNEIGKVEFKDGCFGASYFSAWERKYSFGDWHFHRIGQIDKWQDMNASGEMKYTYEVIGNIHDNPELLEVTA